MTAGQLLQHFDRLIEAPNAISRLRHLILNLAIRGVLVPPDPHEGSAAELVDEIIALKGAPVRHLEGLNSVFRIPAGWVWAPLGDVVISRDAERVPVSREERKFRAKLYPYYGASGVIDKIDGYLFDRPLLLVGEDGANLINRSTPIAFIARGKYWVNNHAHVLDGISEHFLRYLEVFLNAIDLVPYVTGTAQPKMNQTRMNSIPIALPPRDEQRRIVAKVDELFSICDQLGAAQKERERRRTLMVSASLDRLNASVANLREHARFHFRYFEQVTTRREHVEQLRQTILNLAVRGQLVSQDQDDEPIAEVLKRMTPPGKPARYERRTPELIRGTCGLSINHPNTTLPNGWLWVPLIDVARLESGHTPSRNHPEWWNGDVPWVGLVDARIHNNATIFETLQHTNQQGLANSAARLLPAGTVCFSRTASVGYVVTMGRSMATSQDFVNWVPTEAISSAWLQLVMIAERPATGRFSKGAVHQTIYYPAWLSMHIALPPVAEQRRIVTKVNDLMILCDRLESQVTVGQDNHHRLLEAVLYEALRAPSAMTAWA